MKTTFSTTAFEPKDHGPARRGGRVGLLLLVLALMASGCQHARSRPAAIRHHPEVSTTARQSEADIALLTYNIWGLPSWLTRASSGRYARISRELSDREPEIVLLQEAWLSSARKALPQLGAWSVARGPRCTWFGRPSGLVTLSKYPIISGTFHPFEARAWPDSIVRKGALKVTIDLAQGRRLNIWNVHLQAGAREDVRVRQIEQLGTWIHESDDGQIVDLIAGDFNCTPDSAEYERLTVLLGWDVHSLTGQRHFVTFDGLSRDPAQAKTLDYVFIRPKASVQLVPALPQVVFTADHLKDRLSDHLGIHVTMNLILDTDPELRLRLDHLAWMPSSALDRTFLPSAP